MFSFLSGLFKNRGYSIKMYGFGTLYYILDKKKYSVGVEMMSPNHEIAFRFFPDEVFLEVNEKRVKVKFSEDETQIMIKRICDHFEKKKMKISYLRTN